MPRLARWLRATIDARRARQRAGQALVEFTLVALFALLPMTLGLIEIGRGVWYYNQVSHLAREGARWLVVVHAKDQVDGTSNFTSAGNASAGSQEYTLDACGCGADTAVGWVGQLAAGLDPANTTVLIRRASDHDAAPWSLSAYQHGRPIYVQVTYDFHPLATSFLNIPTTIELSASTTMNLE